MKNKKILAIALGLMISTGAFAKNIAYQIVSEGAQVSCVATHALMGDNVCNIKFNALNPFASYTYNNTSQTLFVRDATQQWHIKLLTQRGEKIVCESLQNITSLPVAEPFQYCEDPGNKFMRVRFVASYPNQSGVIYSNEVIHLNFPSVVSVVIHVEGTALAPSK
jgi:hypothetical protein